MIIIASWPLPLFVWHPVGNRSLLRKVFLVASCTDLDSGWLSRASEEQAWRAVWEGGNNLIQNQACSEMLKYALLGLSSHDSIVLVSCPHLLADTRITTSEASLLAPNRGLSTQDIRVWILSISSVELHCGGILWYSSILFEETEALYFPPFSPLLSSPLSFCLSEPSVPPADHPPFFNVLSLEVRRTSSLSSWGQRWRVSPCGGDWHIFFWSLDFGPR